MAESSKQKILVVDDEPDAVEFVTAVMEEAGYEVISASNGDEGLQAARTQKPVLVILDVQMPGKDGFATFAEMQKDPELKALPVIMLTGVGERLGLHFSAEDMGDYLGDEPEAYIEKPVDPQALKDTVRGLLADPC